MLAPLLAEVIGVDADAEMVAEARRRAAPNTRFAELRAEELPAGLGTFRVATFAQSFHWMDRERVAAIVKRMLEPGGAWVHVGATTHRGVDGTDPLPAPRPPHDEIDALVVRYLGDTRRPGLGGEEGIMAAAGFDGPRRIELGQGRLVERSEDDVVASVFSLSWAAPHRFGERMDAFESELRGLLRAASPGGRFCERAREIELVIWRV